MGCIFVLIALLAPRALMFFIWLLTDWFSQAFQTVIWPLLGFILMPYTTLACMAAMLRTNHRVSGGWLVLIIVAALVDLGHWGGGSRTIRRRERD